MSDEVTLTLGSRYLVKSILTRETTQETEGVFKGVTTVGTNDALVLELGAKAGPLKGHLRVIPTHMIVSIDILEAAKPKDAAKTRTDEENVHYG
jgi:hypothetical protein